MSLAQQKLQVFPEINDTMHIDQKVDYHAYLGGSTTSYKEVIAQSYSNSQCSFSANPPSPNIVVDRECLLKCPVTITINGTPAAGTRLYQSQYMALRAMPLHSIMNNLQLTLNNTKFTVEASEVVNEMMLYRGEEREQVLMSTTPCYPDQSQEYAEAVLTNRNPLAQAFEKASGVEFRGGFPYDSITNAVDGTSCVITTTLTEALMLSPLLWGGARGKGLFGCQNMSVQINWNSDLSRIMSVASGSGSTITSITVTFQQPSLLFKYITPSPTMALPKEVSYDLQQTEVYVSELNSSQAVGSSYTMVSSNIQLNVVPRYLMIFAKERRGDRLYTSTDSYQAIQTAEISFANVSGILSGADKRALYDISRSNGCDQSYSEWCADQMIVSSGSSQVVKHGRGGILMLKVGKDFSVSDPSVTVGVPGSYNLQVRLGLKNNNPTRAIVPALYVVPIYAGVLEIKENSSIVQLAVLSQQDVLSASAHSEEHGAFDSYEGGSVWGDISKFGRAAVPYIQKARKVGQAVSGAIPGPQAQAVKSALDVAEAVGLGGKLVGGQKMTRADLKRALQM